MSACVPRLRVDLSAGVADGTFRIGCPIGNTILAAEVEDKKGLIEGHELLQIEVQCTSTIEVTSDLLAIHLDLVKDRELPVLYAVEVGVVASSLCRETCLSVPFGVLDTQILSGDELGIEAAAVFLKGFFILSLEGGKHHFQKCPV